MGLLPDDFEQDSTDLEYLRGDFYTTGTAAAQQEVPGQLSTMSLSAMVSELATTSLVAGVSYEAAIAGDPNSDKARKAARTHGYNFSKARLLLEEIQRRLTEL